MPVPTFEDVATAILTGHFDDRLEPLIQAMQDRKKTAGRKLFWDLKPGDSVRISNTARPSYLQGATGKVRELRNKNIVLDLDQPQGRFHRGIVVPPDMLTKIGQTNNVDAKLWPTGGENA